MLLISAVGILDVTRLNNLSLVCLYISFLLFGHFFFFFVFFGDTVCQQNKKCPNNKKEIYNDKYKHTRDRLFGLGCYLNVFL